MHRFFVRPQEIGESDITLSPEVLKHMQVLRIKPDEKIVLCDGSGTDYICVCADGCARILTRVPNQAEPKISCHVYLALSKGERLEWAIQKSVELGAVSISLFPSARSIAKFDDKTVPKKITRFTQIAEEAAKQAGRGIVPEIRYLPNFGALAEGIGERDLTLFFYELESQMTLTKALQEGGGAEHIHLIIGPEGGFSEEETIFAQNAGFVSVSLGKRILRCETAPVAALSMLMFWAGEC